MSRVEKKGRVSKRKRGKKIKNYYNEIHENHTFQLMLKNFEHQMLLNILKLKGRKEGRTKRSLIDMNQLMLSDILRHQLTEKGSCNSHRIDEDNTYR